MSEPVSVIVQIRPGGDPANAEIIRRPNGAVYVRIIQEDEKDCYLEFSELERIFEVALALKDGMRE